ncbi:MAG: D-tyrosyl-tRNA(Tyr) deacylase [Clostridiales bacterium]|nr:MAG: D-tyrosyl-tRNA(Tyr) deacylase [Clostridiales bacterium]
MRAVVQRVKSSAVSVDGEIVAKIGRGLNVLLGVHEIDEQKDIDFIVDKIANLRIFDDSDGVMNLSVSDVGGEVLVVSQFTLLADARKGRRPSYAHAAKPEKANDFYQELVDKLRDRGLSVATGKFRTEMTVSIENDGPVTILLDSHKNF